MPRSTTRRRYLELLSAGLLGSLAGCMGDGSPTSGDDASFSGSANDGSADSVGLTAGGAQDAGDFRNNVEEGYLPLPESVSYEGLFSEYYFETGGDGGCESLFCASYSPAQSPDPLSGELERYFTVGLDSGRSVDEFERPPVNLVVVLDVSGSMGESFDQYYYDGDERKRVEGETDEPKIWVARNALLTLLDQLEPDDRLGIVLFESDAELLQPLTGVGELAEGEVEGAVSDITAGGGTDISAGIRLGLDELAPYRGETGSEYEHRIAVLTDAQPNVGETSASGLRGTLEDAADDGLHTSFVGVGLDFNPELVDRITSIRGANYYTVRSAEEFERRMGEEFAYMVSPMVFDLSVELEAADAQVVNVYGTSVDDAATASLVHVPTLFPSPTRDGKTRGGVVLVEVEGVADGEPPTLTASWETTDGELRSQTATVSFPGGTGAQYANTGVRKAVLLARYGKLLRNWAIYERDGTLVDAADGIGVPPERGLGRWEQTSHELQCSERYRDRFGTFQEHLRSEMQALGDEDLQQELDLIEQILAAPTPEAGAEDSVEEGDAAAGRGGAGASRRGLFGALAR